MKLICAILAGCFGLLAQNGLAVRDAHYRLQSEDKVEVQYRYTPEYNSGASIQPDGYVSLPLTGEVKLEGLTLEEASAAIRKKAGERLNEPEVMVLLRDYVKPYFVAAGEVQRTGRIELHGQVTLLEAIAMSGGFKDSAQRTQVLLLRKASHETAEVKVFDMRKLMSRSGLQESILIQPGDLLVVPRNAFSKVEPYVKIAESSLLATANILLGVR